MLAYNNLHDDGSPSKNPRFSRDDSIRVVLRGANPHFLCWETKVYSNFVLGGSLVSCEFVLLDHFDFNQYGQPILL